MGDGPPPHLHTCGPGAVGSGRRAARLRRVPVRRALGRHFGLAGLVCWELAVAPEAQARIRANTRRPWRSWLLR